MSDENKPIKMRRQLQSDGYPIAMEQAGLNQLKIVWNDKHESEYLVRDLRLACPCASCIDEWTGEQLLDAASVPENVHPNEITSVGRYAIAFSWSDGHSSGIYTFSRLRTLCPCSACRSNAKTNPSKDQTAD